MGEKNEKKKKKKRVGGGGGGGVSHRIVYHKISVQLSISGRAA